VVEYNDDYGKWLDDDLAFRKAFPKVPESEIEGAKARIKRYVILVYRIYDRITEDPVLYERFKKRLEEERQNDKK
jgi:hypothetical protein